MKTSHATCLTACILVLGINAFAQTYQGKWKLDAAQSDFGSDPDPKSVTLSVVKDTPEKLSWHVSGRDHDGKRFMYWWDGPEDGTMRTVHIEGRDPEKQSAKKEQDGSLLRHGEKADGSSFDARSKLSDNGYTMTDEVVNKSKDGKEMKQRYVYHRVDHGRGKPD